MFGAGSNSEASSQRILSLYRRLLRLVHTPCSGEEIIQSIVDSVQEHFPECRVAISRLDGSQAEVLYARDPGGISVMSGRRLDLSAFPRVLEGLRAGLPIVVDELRNFASPEEVEKVIAMGALRSRVDVPFADGSSTFVLSLAQSQPRNWEEETIRILQEVSELVAFLVRDARTRDALKRSETLFRQFADNMNVVLWMFEPNTNRSVYVSPAFEKVWGIPAERLYESPYAFIEAIHPEDRERVRSAVARHAEVSYEETYRVVRPNGEIRWVKDRGFPVRDESGRVLRVAGIAEDITLLHDAREKLETTQAQVISNAKFAALGEMASGIAHEINNPLAVIHGLAVQMQEIFRKEAPPNRMVQESLSSMEKMANRIAGIVKGLRTFSRQSPGDPMLPADLNSIVLETMALIQAKLRAASVSVDVQLPDRKVGVKCRSSEISQVLLNLISNAYDAVSAVADRAVIIDVSVSQDMARLAVEDSGGGIPAELRDRIFQPFFTTKEVGRGTGLGLSISKGIIEAHGGRLFLDTTSPRTRIVVELPLVTL